MILTSSIILYHIAFIDILYALCHCDFVVSCSTFFSCTPIHLQCYFIPMSLEFRSQPPTKMYIMHWKIFRLAEAVLVPVALISPFSFLNCQLSSSLMTEGSSTLQLYSLEARFRIPVRFEDYAVHCLWGADCLLRVPFPVAKIKEMRVKLLLKVLLWSSTHQFLLPMTILLGSIGHYSRLLLCCPAMTWF